MVHENLQQHLPATACEQGVCPAGTRAGAGREEVRENTPMPPAARGWPRRSTAQPAASGQQGYGGENSSWLRLKQPQAELTCVKG